VCDAEELRDLADLLPVGCLAVDRGDLGEDLAADRLRRRRSRGELAFCFVDEVWN
jgi:hypothetical protein